MTGFDGFGVIRNGYPLIGTLQLHFAKCAAALSLFA